MGCCGAMVGADGLPDAAEGSFFQFLNAWRVSRYALPLSVEALEAGEVLTAMDGGSAAFETPVDDVLHYRSAVSTLLVGVPWISQWFGFGFATEGAAGYAIALRAGNLKWLRVFHPRFDPTLDVDLTYVVVVNSVDTALAVTLNAGRRGPAQNLTTSVPVVAGDKISFRVDGITQSLGLRSSADYFLEM